MNKHTPGPWRYEYETGYCGELIAAHGRCIASFIDEPSKHDARLIAASPDLLDALRELLAVAPSTPPAAGLIVGIEQRHRAALDAARAAIKKATGDEP